jgi:hypothetical protein
VTELRQLHAPRTGGTALAWALRGTSVRRSGHSVRLANLAPEVRVITTIRDPVARFASTWGWLTTYGIERTPAQLVGLREMVIGHQDLLAPQSWWLGPSERLHAMALWIGQTETLDVDFDRLRALLGLGPEHRLPPHGHPNRNEGLTPPDLDPSIVAAIRERYAEDYELFKETGAMPKHPKVVTVVPSPDLHPTAVVRGIPARGKQLPYDEAKPLLDAGLVIILEEPEEPPADEEQEV